MLNSRVKAFEEHRAILLITVLDYVSEEVQYELIENILEHFYKILMGSENREQKKN